ncbi:beta strand repeat-containing protein [Inquilinus sp. CA228]|uniref:beta strand repeat-containing protein n=1 Tax=Inquilinus sp. CA228 TaxID=3455609 RepID=UPI003F8D7A22
MTQTLNGDAGNNTLTGTDPGNAGNPDGIDIINGLDGNDTLSGLGGNDTISGGLGADILDGGAGFDTLSFAAATAGVWVNINGAAFGGEAVGDTMTGFEAIIGSNFNDIFGGDAGNNTINGGAGTDIISISGGTDFLDGGAGGDFLDCRTSGSAVIINMATGIGGGGAAGTTFANFESVIATNFNDVLTAAAGGSTLGGLSGNDTLNGGDGNDVLLGDDFLNVIGTSGNDTLSGGAGNDYLQGGALGDILNGGADSDTAAYEYSGAGVIVNVDTGVASGGDAQGDTLTGVENLIGSAFDDFFGVSAAANFFDGRAGVDAVTYGGSTAGVLANLQGVGHFGWAEGDTFANMENLIGSNFADTLYGNAGNNILDGGEGNDLLEGLVGADTLQGGNGSDTASYTFSAAGVTADLKAGFFAGGDAQGDVLQSIENLTGSGFADTLRGDDGANVIDGGGGNDQIASYGGADAINGGAGVDTIYYDVVAVTVNLATGQGFGGDAQGDTYQNVENVVGTALNDILIGNAGANGLSGGAGDDTLTGLGGADFLQGGAGIDTVSYATSSNGVAANLTSGQGTFTDAQGDTYYGIENLVGAALADSLTGDAGNNALSGGAGDDKFGGFGGADAFDGGAGIDIVYYDAAAGAVQVNLATGTGTGSDAQGDTFTGIENVYGTNFNDLLIGDAGANALSGADGDDTIRSGAGNDVVSGGTGNDLINAYSGADAIDGGAGIDTVYYDSSTVGVAANLANGTGAGGDAQGDTLTGVENLVGSGLNDTLTGNGGANSLAGGDGDDLLRGGAGADALSGGNGVDSAEYTGSAAVSVNLLTGTGTGGDAQGDTLSGIENLFGTLFADTFTGDAGANILAGGDGDDVLLGGGGGDQLRGGNDVDTASYAGSAAAVQVDLSAGTGTGGDAQGDTLTNIENLIGSSFNDTLTGNAGANALNGGAGNDQFNGHAGADSFVGGAGIDTVFFNTSTAGINANLTTGVGLGGDSAGDTYSGIENLVGSAFADAMNGDAGVNTLDGGAGDDVLAGRGGADILQGGAGIDSATYGSSAVGVTINLATGTGTGSDAQGDTLFAIENVTGSAFNDTLIGDAGVNDLRGDVGDDVIRGGAGADRIGGGAGVDTADYSTSSAGVTIDLAAGTGTGGDAQGDTLFSIETVTGSGFADTLYGSADANALSGGAGNDVLYGRGGADVLDGGNGTDGAGYFESGGAVTVDLAAGTGSGGDAQGDVLSNIENLGGSIFADTLTGSAGANAINGGGGNDTIAGAAGSDTLYGGNGNDQINGGADGDALIGEAGTDTLNGGDGNDVLNGGADADVINGGAGIDIADYNGSGVGVTVNLATNINTGGYAQGDTLTNVENVQGSAFGDNLTGDGAANTLRGMVGNDVLNGGAGWDTLEGGSGDDQLVGGAGGDLLRGGAGADHLTGGADNDIASYWDSTVGVTINLQTGVNTGGTAQGDTIDSDIEIINGSNHNDVMTGNVLANELVGFDGADTLSGGGGGDTLRGGAGADVLNGGSGVDYFSYTALSDSTVSAADTIQDFQAGDLIWVRTIDADGSSANGDTAFTFIGAGAFSGTAGELRVVTAGSIQVVSADVNGDTVADFSINVTSDHALTASDFLL